MTTPIDPPVAVPAESESVRSSKRRALLRRFYYPIAWICVAVMLLAYSFRLAKAGSDLRWGFWDYWHNNRFYGDVDTAFHHGHFILRHAAVLERKDLHDHPSDSKTPQLTLSSPGPGLFETPLSLATFKDRWHQLQPVYSHIYRGWVTTYDQLLTDVPDGDYQMDYPPLRSLVMTLWAWKVDSEHAGLVQVPRQPVRSINRRTNKHEMVSAEIVHPLLVCNMFFEAVTAITLFFLVWLWVHRDPINPLATDHWRHRWGDPLLLAPAILLGIITLLGPYIRFELADLSPGNAILDTRITSIGWWIHLILTFVSVVSLARLLPRPFRGIACGTLAMTVAWMNPATVLESFGWPQWEAWLIPFYLIPALLVSLDWWLTAGLILSVGCMFKGQLMFVAPLLLLCPLFAGWFGRFMRIVAGFGAGAGLIVWPWLITTGRAEAYIVAVVFASGLICTISLLRRRVWKDLRNLGLLFYSRLKMKRSTNIDLVHPAYVNEIRWPIWTAITVAISVAAYLSLLIYKDQDPSWHRWDISLMLGVLAVPWLLPRRHIAAWIVFTFAASLWLAGASLNGSFSWWQVGFVYGTQKHQDMQLGNQSLSNLSSLLEDRYNWNLHDAVAHWHLPLLSNPIDLDVQSASATLFGITLLLCTVAAAVHLRRRDKQFLVALVAPWILFVTLLTQMAARYMVFPAVIAAVLIGVSVGTSLLQVLLITVSCAMLGNQLLNFDPQTAPITYAITRRTFPDMGWMTLLLAGVFLILAMMPSKPTPDRLTLKPK